MSSSRPTLLLSVDFEDWHQLVRRRVGASNWRERGPGARPPDRRAAGAARRASRARDVLRARDGGPGPPRAAASGSSPPATRSAATAMPICPCTRRRRRSSPPTCAPPGPRSSELTGSHADRLPRAGVLDHRRLAAGPTTCWRRRGSPMTRASTTRRRSATEPCRRRRPAPPRARRRQRRQRDVGVSGRGVARRAGVRSRSGGASYWQVLPTRAILKGLIEAGPLAGLYLHPNELDPSRLHALPPERRDRPPSEPTPGCARRSATAPAGVPPACCGRSRGGSS